MARSTWHALQRGACSRWWIGSAVPIRGILADLISMDENLGEEAAAPKTRELTQQQKTHGSASLGKTPDEQIKI